MSAEFIGGDAIKAKLQQIIDARPKALLAAGVTLLTLSQQSILQQGPGWPGFKRQPKRAHQLLFLTGTLLRSLAYGASDNITQEDDNSITVGSAVTYARAQNLGDPKHNLPARTFLYIDDRRLQLARASYLAQIVKAWNT